MEEECKVCKKTFKSTSILRHIASSKSCKSLYNEEDIKQLRNNSSRRVSIRKQSFYVENSEILKAKQRKYNKDHADEIKEKQREYNKKHAEEIKSKQRDYNKKHAEEIKQKQKDKNKKHAEKRIIEWQKEMQKGREQAKIFIEKKAREDNLDRSKFEEELAEISNLKRHGIDENCRDQLQAMENSIRDTYLEIEKEIDEWQIFEDQGPRKYMYSFIYSPWISLKNQIRGDLETIAKKFNYKLKCFKCAPKYQIICDKCKAMLK